MEDGTEFEGTVCLAETDQAILVQIDGEEHWVPKSVIHDDSEVAGKDDTGTLVVATWFAEKELG